MKFSLFGRTFYFLSDARQIDKAINILEKYFIKPEVLVLLIVFVVYFVIRFAARVLNKEKLRNILRKISPWIYLFFILGLTVLNRDVGTREIRVLPDAWFAGEENYHESNIIVALFNIVFYIPYGFILYRWSKFKRLYITTVVIVFGTSLLTEVLQYVLARGISTVEDVGMNVIGGCIGALIAVVLKKIHNKEDVK